MLSLGGSCDDESACITFTASATEIENTLIQLFVVFSIFILLRTNSS